MGSPKYTLDTEAIDDRGVPVARERSSPKRRRMELSTSPEGLDCGLD